MNVKMPLKLKVLIGPVLIVSLVAFGRGSISREENSPAGTVLPTPMTDPAAEMVDGLHRFLDAQLEALVQQRESRVVAREYALVQAF
jgi:hypothetical protein